MILIRFYISTFLAFFGVSMVNYTFIIMIKDLTGSDANSGFIYMSHYLPFIAFNFAGGILSDHFSRKRILLLAQSAYILTSIAAIFLFQVGIPSENITAIFIPLVVFNGIGLAFFPAARFAMIGDLAPKNKIGLATIIVNITYILGLATGPAFVGRLRATNDWPTIFWAILIVFLISQALLLSISHMQEASPGRRTILAEAGEVLHYVKEHRYILHFFIMTCVIMFALGPHQVLMPAFAGTHLGLGESERGLFMGTFGLGLLFGGILAVTLDSSAKSGRWILAATAMEGVMAFFLSFSATPVTAGLLFGAVGITGGLAANLVSSALQKGLDNRIRGRIMSVYSLTQLGVPALAAGGLGLVAEHAGMHIALGAIGVIMTSGAGAIFVFSAIIRNLSGVPADSTPDVI